MQVHLLSMSSRSHLHVTRLSGELAASLFNAACRLPPSLHAQVVQSPLFTRRSSLGERGRGLATMLGSITGPLTTMYGTSPLSRRG